MSIIVVEVDGQGVGVVGIRDELRPEAAGAMATLHEQGIATVMLTGDKASLPRRLPRRPGSARCSTA